MSFFTLKSLIALIFILAGLTAFSSMLTLMGKPEKKLSPKTLKTIHKTAGYLFFLLLCLLVLLGANHWSKVGDQIPLRAVFHLVLALSLIIVFLVKLSIARIFRQFLKFMPVLGIMVFSFAFVTAGIMAGFYVLRSQQASLQSTKVNPNVSVPDEPDITSGQQIFQNNCSFCHSADTNEKITGPGLKGLLKNKKLPVSGREATLENVRSQILKPFSAMPPFTIFSKQQLENLLAYLKTL